MNTAIGLFLSLVIAGSVFAQGISVNFDGAKVVFLDENYILNKVDDQGNVSPVLSTNVVVTNILLSAQGNLFVVFQSSQQLGDGNNYVLACAVPTNNTISGIDTNSRSIAWELGSGVSPALQSDAAGNLYYRTANDYNFSLKKCVNGNGTNIVDLINDDILVYEWLVRPDGTVLMGESVSEGLLYWKLVKLAPDNTLSELATNAYTSFLLDFPDGNVYAGLWYNAPYFGVYKLPVALTNFDGNTPYIGGNQNSPVYNVNDLAMGHDSTYVEHFIFTCGSTIVKCVKTDDGRAIVLAGAQLTPKTIVQYYPIPKIIEPTLIDRPTLIEKMTNLLLIAGTKNGTNTLISYDPATSNETSLLDENIEIYHLKSLYDGYIWFDGLKFSGNQYVVGKIQITNNPASSGALRGAATSAGSFQEITTLSGKPRDFIGIIANPYNTNGVLNNYDGDGKSDLAVYQDGLWYIYSFAKSSTLLYGGRWGGPDSTPMSGDYDGDGKSDLAVYQDGLWYIYSFAKSSTLLYAGRWGGSDSTPISGDYDGDGKSDMAVYQDGLWYIYSFAKSSTLLYAGRWGGPDSIPISGDYDGDGKSDLTVYQDGLWYIYSFAKSSTLLYGGRWGGPDSIPVQ